MTCTSRLGRTLTPAQTVGLIALLGVVAWTNNPAMGEESDREHRLTPIVRAVRDARPAVVNIQGQKSVAAPRSSEPTDGQRQVNGMGTGIIIDPRGFILTNYHVVEDVRRINVTLDDGQSFVADLVARDNETDLAVIKIKIGPGESLPTIPVGTSSDLMEGETVIALGNAYGYEHTVTLGIISALHRDVQVSDSQGYDDLIQTDASINPGNSGGPLLNIDGEMVGVNVAVRAGAQGIGFAIPVDAAMKIAADLLSVERLENKWHGLVTQSVDGHRGPLVVKQVLKSSPAAESGLKPGDIIDRVGAMDMERPLDLERVLLGRRVGDKVEIDVRRDDEPLTLDLVVASRNSATLPGPTGVTPSQPTWELLGMELNEEPQTTFSTRNTRYRGGMRVVRVREGGPAAEQGIVPGDILVGMHKWETASDQDVSYIISRPNLADMGPVKFYVLRGRETLYGQLILAKQPVATTSR